MIVVGVYLALVALVLVIRQCLKVSTRFFYNSYHLKQRHRPRFSFSYEVTRKYCRNVDLRELLFQINYYISGMWMEHWIFYLHPSSPLPMEGKICDRVCSNIISRKVTTFWTPLMQFSEVPTINNGVLEFGLPQWGFRLCVE